MQKKLYKVEEGKVVQGVCGGVAEYFNLDATIVRVGWAVISCVMPVAVIAYFVAAAIMPTKISD